MSPELERASSQGVVSSTRLELCERKIHDQRFSVCREALSGDSGVVSVVGGQEHMG